MVVACLVVMLFGFLVVWLLGCLVCLLVFCLVVWLFYCYDVLSFCRFLFGHFVGFSLLIANFDSFFLSSFQLDRHETSQPNQLDSF